MYEVSIFFFLLMVCNIYGQSNYSFPENFMFGTASSAYQIEGAWNDDGKGENIWDYAIHQNGSIIADGKNADDADQSFYYEGSKADLDNLIKMNVSHYKLSISWSRVFPEGIFMNDTEIIVGLGHYQYQIDDLIKNNITPIVTLYHWDLPQVIQEWGGWTNESNIDLFVDYADQVFKYLFDVKYFITFNEPKQICKGGYGDGTLAPFISDSGISDYKCAYVVLKAHAAIYRLYQEKYSDNGAKISIALDGSWSEPKSDSKDDKNAAERRNKFEFGLYANPIFNGGDWPQEVIDRVGNRSSKENLTESRLPKFTEDEKKAISGSADFLALNFFDARLVADKVEADFDYSSYDNDIRIEISSDPSWKEDTAGNMLVPRSIRSFLNYVKSSYGDPDILITGNGLSDDSGTTDDDDRVSYLSEYLTNVLEAIYEDKVKVFGYTYWSLLDSFEWTKGYKPHFGLLGIGHEAKDDSNIQRLPKKSAEFYRLVILEKKIPDPSEITTPDYTIPDSTTPDSTIPDSTTPDSTTPNSSSSSVTNNTSESSRPTSSSTTTDSSDKGSAHSMFITSDILTAILLVNSLFYYYISFN